MNAPRLYDAWLFKSEEWTRRPLGLHPDAESALAEAKENHPDVVQVVLASAGEVLGGPEHNPNDYDERGKWTGGDHRA